MDDFNPNREEKPLILIMPQAYPKEEKPKPRPWRVAQVVPLVLHGVSSNGTQAAALLNLSSLPLESSPQRCLAWAEVFLEARRQGKPVKEAVRLADRSQGVGKAPAR